MTLRAALVPIAVAIVGCAASSAPKRRALEPARQLATSRHGLCVITPDERARCVGVDPPTEQAISTLSESAACAVTSSASIRCRVPPKPRRLQRTEGYRRVAHAMQDRHSGDEGRTGCGFDERGRTRCWGMDAQPRLVHGRFETQAPLPPRRPLASLDIAGGTACGVLRASGRVRCWGNDPDIEGFPPDSGRFRQIAWTGESACALRDDKRIACWGLGSDPFAFEGRDDYDQAVPPQGPHTLVRLAAHHGCALRTDGRAVCWGRGNDAAIEDEERELYGQAAPPPDRFVDIALGELWSCGLRPPRDVVCWGHKPRWWESSAAKERKALGASWHEPDDDGEAER